MELLVGDSTIEVSASGGTRTPIFVGENQDASDALDEDGAKRPDPSRRMPTTAVANLATKAGWSKVPGDVREARRMNPATVYALVKAVLEGDHERARVLAHDLLSDAA